MLAILRIRTRVTRRELAEMLEVSEREVTRYKDELESVVLQLMLLEVSMVIMR